MEMIKACAAVAVVLGMAGCAGMRGKSEPVAAAEKEQEAEAKLCKHMTDRQTAIQAFPQVDTASALESVKAASDEVHAAVRALSDARGEVSNPNLLGVQAANEKLQKDVNEVPGGRATVGETAGTINQDAQELQTVWDQLYTELQCGA